MTNDASSVQPKTRADLEQVPAYVPGKTVPGALKIASNEMTQPPLPSVVEAISQTISDPTTSPNRYPDMGAVDLRIKLGEHLRLPMEQVAVGCGSSALCLQLVQATCADGDEVVFPWRSFEAYPILARVAGATPVPVPLDAQGRNDLSAMAAAITDRTRLVFVCNPNNPTGTTVTREAFAEFMAQVPGDVVVALDEAYIELVDEATHAATPLAHELLDTYPNLVGLRTFSKVYGLAGLRVGYMFGPEKLVEAVNKVAIPFSVNTLAQIAALTSLDAQEELTARIAEVRAQRVAVTEAINAATGRETVLPNSQANFIWIGEDRIADLSLLDDVSVATTTDLGDFLAQRNILIRCFAGEGARITITTEEETSQLLAALGIEH
ncbi:MULTISPECIES: histidinol-phosphate transaminase [Corynebacterium]|uniref:Histidinol-phosphate transaminase n=1 Tax=Corynebacterium amycolatum TaxID=43765 RepID=A0AB38XWQ4_CORAY|nr:MULTISPECIES: histidinol-phosphate transaminase [Corynebacterium]AIN83085.1 putative phenylalanine aminotransferase [Corynebacterium sp. ATCC 6931]MBC6726006.1 histidinol-phosphate transaminase [Corynebacterium amycolatum]MBC6758995.1 histidinol-phosphate transaminase [Corynebacterium sp. LK24]MCT1718692.1 histidinol-phosphate transaminase [Corynebacterium amycolatum]MDK8819978.1 histidinol-phosphate transaminase [Corynebacterium amycolatum]